MGASATGGSDPPPAASGEPPAPPVTPPTAPVAQGETVTRPEAAPVTRAEARIGAGLPFWKPLMWVVGGSIAGLVFVLLIVELWGALRVDGMYADALRYAQASGPIIDLQRLEGAMLTLSTLKKGPANPLTSDQKIDLAYAVANAKALPILAETQRSALDECARTGNDPLSSGNAPIEECQIAFGALRAAGLTRMIEVDRLRLMQAMANDAREHHQAFRAFWLQSAQLVLLNLLLPILTAFLGYVFGAQSRREE